MNDDKAALSALLVFYSEAGVDTSLGETASDRLAPEIHPADSVASAPPARTVKSGAASPSAAAPPTFRPVRADPIGTHNRTNVTVASTSSSPESGVMAARAAAKAAGTLEELRGMLATFEGCTLRQTATRLAFADGNPGARVMFVGEAPGREEDIAGLPFVGRSGKLLDRMMAAIGLDRSSAYIANIVPWRPPGNRTPTPQESAMCLPFTLRQIELANPDILVCLGGPSAQTLLNVRDGILKVRGRWFPFSTGTREIRAIATLHPAYLLRQPVQKRLAWRDFLSIRQALRQAAQT
ncbi:MAG TPA: uracil-DNA glycosylase [Xanthobacteraceae bacterium]|jgi:DNA polymerase